MVSQFSLNEELLEAARIIRDGCDLSSREDATLAIVNNFRQMTKSDREELASLLGAISGVLVQEVKFQPKIFNAYIRIPVTSDDQARQVQEKLINFGCGFHNGSYPLQKEAFIGNGYNRLIGIHVSPTGVLGLTFSDNEDWFDKSSDHLVTSDTVFEAQSADDINKILGIPKPSVKRKP